jgi:hypothetical protein
VNWLVFVFLAWVALGLDVGLRDAIAIGDSSITPSFALILCVFVWLWARPGALMLAAILIGLALDVLQPIHAAADPVVVGPTTLGMMLAAYATFTIRGVMLRGNPVTLAVLCALSMLLVRIVAVVLLEIRSAYDHTITLSAWASIGTAGASALYTGLVAALLSPILRWLRPLLRFYDDTHSGFSIKAGRS